MNVCQIVRLNIHRYSGTQIMNIRILREKRWKKKRTLCATWSNELEIYIDNNELARPVVVNLVKRKVREITDNVIAIGCAHATPFKTRCNRHHPRHKGFTLPICLDFERLIPEGVPVPQNYFWIFVDFCGCNKLNGFRWAQRERAETGPKPSRLTSRAKLAGAPSQTKTVQGWQKHIPVPPKWITRLHSCVCLRIYVTYSTTRM